MLFPCDTITDPEIRGKLDRIRANVKSLAGPMVCLPNIHPKAGLESPPQFVAATRGTIVPQLTAPAMNCGMSVFKTDLKKEDFSAAFLQEFAQKLRAGIAPRVTRSQTIRQWLWPRKSDLRNYVSPTYVYNLTEAELEDFFINGAEAAVRKYHLPPTELEHIEYRGCVLTEEEKKSIDLADLVPRSSYINGRHEMGYNFGGNHFLEFHYVEEVRDAEKAAAWGIAPGQIMMFYHGGGGHATYHLGRYFGRREKNTSAEKVILFWLKLFFPFGSWDGIMNFPARWHAYFSRKPFPETPLDSPEGRRLMNSIKIGLNYGYGFRAALLKRINDALPKGSASFVWDAAHNSIMEEVINGEHVIVHRQDAMRAFPGRPAMIAGWNTLSYLGTPLEGAEKSMWSITPSAGKTIGKYKKEGLLKEDASHVTFLSKRKEPQLIRNIHTTSEGLFAVVDNLEKEGIIKPVAYLRPLGAIKGH